MKGFYPAVAMKVPPGKSRTECEELVLRPCQIRWLASKDSKSYGQILAARPRMSDSEAS